MPALASSPDAEREPATRSPAAGLDRPRPAAAPATRRSTASVRSLDATSADVRHVHRPAGAAGRERRRLRVTGAQCSTPCATSALDLLLGGRCVGCGRPGPAAVPRPARRRCRPRAASGLADPRARPAWRRPGRRRSTPALLRALVLGHKERRLLALPAAGPAARRGAAAAAAPPGRRSCWCRCRRGPAGPRPRPRPDVRDHPRRGRPAPRPGYDAPCAGCSPARGAVATRPGSTRPRGRPTWPARCAARPRRGCAGSAQPRCASWSATTCSPPARPPARPSGRSRRRARGRRGRGGGRDPASARPGVRPRGNLERYRFRRSARATNVVYMESVRVRGCVVGTRWIASASRRQADASRRRNGPRKARPLVRGRRSRCGLDVSPASPPPSDAVIGGRRSVVAREAARASAGDCGVEDQVGRADSCPCHLASEPHASG